MKELHNMENYWNSLPKVDRCSLMEPLYIVPEIGNLEFNDIPSHLRSMFYRQWESKWKHYTHELTF